MVSRWLYFCCRVIFQFVMVRIVIPGPHDTLQVWACKRQVDTSAKLRVDQVCVQSERCLLL